MSRVRRRRHLHWAVERLGEIDRSPSGGSLGQLVAAAQRDAGDVAEYLQELVAFLFEQLAALLGQRQTSATREQLGACRLHLLHKHPFHWAVMRDAKTHRIATNGPIHAVPLLRYPALTEGLDMRVVLIAMTAVAASAGAFVMSQTFNGFPGAAFFMASLFIGPTGLGVAIAMATHPRPRGSRVATAPASQHHIAHVRPSRCGECGGSRHRSHGVWICQTCDLGLATPIVPNPG